MKFGLSEAKIAKFDKITEKYEEIDPVLAIKGMEISAEVTLNKETEKSLFGNSEAALRTLTQSTEFLTIRRPLKPR